MSGNPTGSPTGSNVVPMPHAATPATAPPQMPMPAMWGGGGSLPWGPGCCPPGGMDALMKCYCDVQAATAFICSVMVQCIQQNPAVTAAIIAAIEASGSSLPLVGVTNGSDAQPGQVGEFIEFAINPVTIPVGDSTQTLTLGVLPPGDWDATTWFFSGSAVQTVSFVVVPYPPPAGISMSNQISGWTELPGGTFIGTTIGETARISNSVPALIAFSVTTNAAAAATGAFEFSARRRR